jgi:predicted NACHT family NTPase
LVADGLVPVLVQLKADRTVLEAIANELERGDLELEPKEIKRLLRQNRLVLLLDGVNEIPHDDLRRSLAQFREDNLSVPMVFTTWDLSLGGDLGIEKRFEMQPLSEPQMRDFVGKYLPEQGDRLLGQLRDRLREIAETPLLLKMLCDVFQQTGEVPQNKGELFRGFDRDYEKFKGLPAVSADFRRFKSEIWQPTASQKPKSKAHSLTPQTWKDLLSLLFAGGFEAAKLAKPEIGIPIEILKHFYKIWDRNRKQLPGA